MGYVIKKVRTCDVCGKLCETPIKIRMNWSGANNDDEIIEMCKDCEHTLN